MADKAKKIVVKSTKQRNAEVKKIFFQTASRARPSISKKEGGGRFPVKFTSHTSGTGSGYQTPYPDWGSTVDIEILKLLKSAGDFDTLEESDYFDISMWLYENLPISQMVVMGTADTCMAEGIAIECKTKDDELKDASEQFLMDTNTTEKMYAIIIQCLLFGNTFGLLKYDKKRPKYESVIVDYTIEDTRTFTDISQTKKGIKLYKQEGTETYDFTKTETVEYIHKEPDIAHFRSYNMSSNERWGRSLFRGTIGLCMTLFNALGDLATIIKRYSSPIIVFKLIGLPSNTSRRESIMHEFADQLETQSTGDEWIFDDKVEAQILDPGASKVNPDILSPIERHLVAAFAYPRHLLMDVANRSVADDLDIAFKRRVRSIQEYISRIFTKKILRPAMMDRGFTEERVNNLNFIFNKPPDLERDLFMKAQKNMMLANAFIKHPDEIRAQQYGMNDPYPMDLPSPLFGEPETENLNKKKEEKEDTNAN